MPTPVSSTWNMIRMPSAVSSSCRIRRVMMPIAGRSQLPPCRTASTAPLTILREFDRVTERIGQDLPQPQPVAEQRRLVESSNVLHEAHIVPVCREGEDPSVCDDLLELEGGFLEVQLTGFDLADVLVWKSWSAGELVEQRGKVETHEDHTDEIEEKLSRADRLADE